MITRLDTSAGGLSATLLLSLLAISTPPAAATNPDDPPQAVLPTTPILNPLVPDLPSESQQTFRLRHIYHHGTTRHPGLHRKKDIIHTGSKAIYIAAEDDYPEQEIPDLRVKTKPLKLERLVDRRPSVVDPMVAAARQNGYVTALSPSAWTIDDVSSPDVTEKDTVLALAYMASDAYAKDESDADWTDVGSPYNKSADFGWEGSGLRGHVFADETNSTIVIGLKGTSMAYFDGEGTTTDDKVNDNLFFSCCCAQQGQWSYRQVCDCATSTYSCNNTCVSEALREENRYYQAGRELYASVLELYPDAQVWLTGHSLGGAVTSMLGLTYGIPVVTFEAVPEALPISRLGLPSPPHADPGTPQARQFTGAYHFGHTADPVYMGTCNGATASCSYFGYAMESICHTGEECVYDVVADKGWRVGIGTHRIHQVIRDVILPYDTVPKCKATHECRDCSKWKMYWSNGTETTTSTSSPTSSPARTRTETCKTPGWWGCLDEATTTTGTTTSSTSTERMTLTTSCKTPGWFGCKDRTGVESSTTTTTTTTTATTTDMTTTTTTSTTTTTCLTPGRFWGCNDKTTLSTSTMGSGGSGDGSDSPVTPPASPQPTSSPVTTTLAEATPSSPASDGDGEGEGEEPSTQTETQTKTETETETQSETQTQTQIETHTEWQTQTENQTKTPSQSMSMTSSCAHRHWYGPCAEWTAAPTGEDSEEGSPTAGYIIDEI